MKLILHCIIIKLIFTSIGSGRKTSVVFPIFYDGENFMSLTADEGNCLF